PLDIDLPRVRIDLNVARDGVAERLDLGQRVIREHVRLHEGVATIARAGDPDLACREVVVGDVDLVAAGAHRARIDGQPRPVNEGRVHRGDVVDRPAVAAVIAVGELYLEWH